MKIAIISDTHGNIVNLKKAIEWIKKQKIRLILHCGDISTQEIIDQIKEIFNGDIKFVRGNADFGLALPEMMELKIKNKKIAFCHYPKQAKNLAESGNYDLVFYGHSHQPWKEKIGNCFLINPGETAGVFSKPTFAIYNTASNKLELKIIEKL